MNNLFTFKNLVNQLDAYRGISKLRLCNELMDEYIDNDEKLLYYATIEFKLKSNNLYDLINDMKTKAQILLLRKYGYDKGKLMIQKYKTRKY